MLLKQRNNVHFYGNGPETVVLVHGYGCDQTMWHLVHPVLAERYTVILLDLVGSGGSDLSAYDRERHGTLHGHAADVLEVIDAFAAGPVIYVGHSVGAMIGMLAAIQAPDKFAAQVMIGPSPCLINQGDYIGGFHQADIDSLLQVMDDNYLVWTKLLVPIIMGTPNQPALTKQLLSRFEANDRDITRHFARVTFMADHRADVPKSMVPALILQCSEDIIAPREVGEYLRRHMPNSTMRIVENIGHCPHMSSPSSSVDIITNYLDRLLSQSD